MIKELIKANWYRYQRAMWYFNIAVGEAKKPLVLLNEVTSISILAALVGIKFGFGSLIFVYLIIAVIGIFIGRILVKTGVIKFNTSLGNYQNEEFLKVLNGIEKIEKEIKDINAKLEEG